MRQHSFTARLKSLAVVFGIAMAFASCANEDVAQTPTSPNDDNDKNLTTFVAGDETKTRTSMDYNSGDFYWEAGDYIYVKDDDGTWQKSTNAPTSKVAAFKYKVPGKFTASTSYKVYYLGKNSSGNAVTISSTQQQTSPDNTEHFGTSGDYGSATANKVTGKQQFKFTLEHQPAYLVFQPYTSNTVLQNCYLRKIEVTSDNDIAETYTINPSTDNLDASAGGKQIVLTTGGWSSSSNPHGFPLTNSSASRTTNGAYMIIKPGSHILRVRYWVKDIVTNVEGTITKLLPSTNYVSNTYYDVTANLNTRAYDGNHYYMWDAQEQYWKGYEWTKHLPGNTGQPTVNGGSSPNYPQSNTDPRYWNEGHGSPFNATHSCATLPNANEMSWYCMYGDPRWDKDELWTLWVIYIKVACGLRRSPCCKPSIITTQKNLPIIQPTCVQHTRSTTTAIVASTTPVSFPQPMQTITSTCPPWVTTPMVSCSTFPMKASIGRQVLTGWAAPARTSWPSAMVAST